MHGDPWRNGGGPVIEFPDLTPSERPVASIDRRADLDRFGSFVVVEKIASGGMAEIYKAHLDGQHDEPVALKRIRPDCDDDPEFRKMMLDEAKIASLLEHPNIARVLGVEAMGEQLGLILEYVDAHRALVVVQAQAEGDEGLAVMDADFRGAALNAQTVLQKQNLQEHLRIHRIEPAVNLLAAGRTILCEPLFIDAHINLAHRVQETRGR